MTYKLLKLATAAAIALTPFAAWSQTGKYHQGDAGPAATSQGAAKSDKDSPKMQKPGAIQKQTNPQKNGRSQSESVSGMNKNGQPQR